MPLPWYDYWDKRIVIRSVELLIRCHPVLEQHSFASVESAYLDDDLEGTYAPTDQMKLSASQVD